MTATRFVVSHIAAALQDCNRDLVDLGAVEQMLDTTAVWGPLLGAAIRDRYSVEILAATLARISDFGISILDAHALDCLVNLEPTAVVPKAFDAAPAGAGDPLSPDVLAEYVAEQLADTVAFLHVGHGPVEVIELDPTAESDIRDAVATGTGTEPVYGASAAPVLRMLEQRLCRADPETAVVLAASPDIRRHVRRLIAAQFPRLSVLSLTHLAARPGSAPPAAG
jgi:flagellar biosynthesis component FlhA